jgi:hypothetical protein
MIPSTTYQLAKFSELLQGTDGRLPAFSFLRISDNPTEVLSEEKWLHPSTEEMNSN